MFKVRHRRGPGMAVVLSALALVSACETPPPPPEPPAPAPEPPPPPPPPPPLALNSGVSEAAAIYVAFMRDVRAIDPAIPDSATVLNIMSRGSSYEASQLARGMIAYGAVLALQSPEFVEGVRNFADNPEQRRRIVDQIIADPTYAAQFPGSAAAAGLVSGAIREDAEALTAIAEAVQMDAYTIQGRRDPRRRWATQAVADRDSRIAVIRSLSETVMAPTAEDALRLFAAAHDGHGLDVAGDPLAPPYTPVVVNSLAIAALAALGAGGEEWRANTEALTLDRGSQFCLSLSKLNLYQCIAAARPHYEHIYCAGRHVLGDLASCTSRAAIAPASQTGTALAQTATVAADAAATSTEAIERGPVQPE